MDFSDAIEDIFSTLYSFANYRNEKNAGAQLERPRCDQCDFVSHIPHAQEAHINIRVVANFYSNDHHSVALMVKRRDDDDDDDDDWAIQDWTSLNGSQTWTPTRTRGRALDKEPVEIFLEEASQIRRDRSHIWRGLRGQLDLRSQSAEVTLERHEAKFCIKTARDAP